MSRPRRLKIFRSLNQQNLILGCEREVVLCFALFCVALVFIGQSVLSFVVGSLLWGFGVFFLRKMAKIDPQMAKVFSLHYRYKPYYPARSKHWSV
jgi:type IV secretion system protein VirB3